MSEAQSTWTLDDAASASNPGNLDVSPFRWFRHYPKGPLIWFGSFLFFVALAWLVHWSFWIVALLQRELGNADVSQRGVGEFHSL